MTWFWQFGLAVLLFFAEIIPANAHPHVIVTARSVFVFDTSGKLTGIRQSWVFDEAYSTFAIEGMRKTADGAIEPQELKDMAKLNVESLSDSMYFTEVKQGRKTLALDEPTTDYTLRKEGNNLVLDFFLPLKQKVEPENGLRLIIDDPAYFVAFGFAETDPVTISGTTKCTVDLQRPSKSQEAGLAKVGEDFFNNLKSGFTDQFATRITLKCP